jgi:hypothetical protein
LAEAQHNYKAGQDWWTMPASTAAVQEARLEPGPWDEPLRQFFSANTGTFRIITVSGVNYRFVTSEELLDALGIEVRYRKSHMYRDLAATMQRIGGKLWDKYYCQVSITLKHGGTVEGVRGYRAPVTGNPTAKVIDMPQRSQPF